MLVIPINVFLFIFIFLKLTGLAAKVRGRRQACLPEARHLPPHVRPPTAVEHAAKPRAKFVATACGRDELVILHKSPFASGRVLFSWEPNASTATCQPLLMRKTGRGP